MYRPLVGNKNVSQHYLENRWTPENTNARYPRLTTKQNDNNFRESSIWAENGNFLETEMWSWPILYLNHVGKQDQTQQYQPVCQRYESVFI